MNKRNIEHEEQSLRRTGRTTKLLQQAIDLLYNDDYGNIFFVVHDQHLMSYCAQIANSLVEGSALWDVSTRRLSFKNKYGNIAKLHFITMDKEYDSLRGIKWPVARDHEVLRRRSPFGKYFTHHMEQFDMLTGAGVEPWKELHLPSE